MNKNQKVQSITWVTIVSLIISCITLGVNVYRNRYQDTGIISGTTLEASYSNSSSSTARLDVKFAKGSVKYGAMQSTGNTSIKYTLKYKKNSSSNYTTHRSFTFPKNNKYYGDFALFYANGTSTYNFQIIKTNYLSTQSNIKLDFFLK